MTTASGAPEGGTATQQDAGRICPFCRFPLKAGIGIVRCGGCRAPYHDECWADNAGCAIMGCSGAPVAGAERPLRQAAPVGARPTVSTPVAEGVPVASTAANGGSTRTRSGLALVIAVVAIAVVALAVALTRGDGGSGTGQQTVAGGSEQVGRGGSSSGSDTGSSSDTGGRTGTAPIADDESNRRQIRTVLYRYHEDVLHDDYAGAWALLSHRKQRQKLREDGYGGWRRAQGTLKPYLHPYGIDVSIQALDPRSGVARVMVTGMRWSDQHASCTEWSGITWMKYENGRWKYDPGYSTTTERERQWKPRDAELLGESC